MFKTVNEQIRTSFSAALARRTKSSTLQGHVYLSRVRETRRNSSEKGRREKKEEERSCLCV